MSMEYFVPVKWKKIILPECNTFFFNWMVHSNFFEVKKQKY